MTFVPNPLVSGILANLWPRCLGACVVVTLSMFPGSIIIRHFFGVNDPRLVVNLAIGTFALLFLTIFAGLARDREGEGPSSRTYSIVASK